MPISWLVSFLLLTESASEVEFILPHECFECKWYAREASGMQL
jgi:hypothetical protein